MQINIPNTIAKIINKDILYKDTLLNYLKDNYLITCIDDIEENEIEECLDIILNSNETNTYAAIQYSKKGKKLYFYTSDKLSLEDFELKKIEVLF